MSYEEKIKKLLEDKILSGVIEPVEAVRNVLIWLGCEFHCDIITVSEYSELTKKVYDIAADIIKSL